MRNAIFLPPVTRGNKSDKPFLLIFFYKLFVLIANLQVCGTDPFKEICHTSLKISDKVSRIQEFIVNKASSLFNILFPTRLLCFGTKQRILQRNIEVELEILFTLSFFFVLFFTKGQGRGWTQNIEDGKKGISPSPQ